MCFTVGTAVDCVFSNEEVHKRNSVPTPQNTAHDFPITNRLLRYFLRWRWSVSPLHGVSFQIICYVSPSPHTSHLSTTESRVLHSTRSCTQEVKKIYKKLCLQVKKVSSSSLTVVKKPNHRNAVSLYITL